MLVGNGAGAVTHPIDRAGSVFPRGTGRFLVKKGVHIASFRCLSDETLSWWQARAATVPVEGVATQVGLISRSMNNSDYSLVRGGPYRIL